MGGPFVLVHGAWHGGWCWAGVAEALEERGRWCLAPTLRGCGHRAGGDARAVDADAHVDDVAALFDLLDLQGATLGLHSYAGLLGPALLARLRPRLAHIAWIEAVIPTPGQTMLDLVLPAAAERYRAMAQAAYQDASGVLALPDAAQFNLPSAKLKEQVQARLTPQPAQTFVRPVRAPQADVLAFPGSYLIANDREPQPYEGFATKAQQAGWPVHRVAGGHLLMLTNPGAVADFLTTPATQKTEALA